MKQLFRKKFSWIFTLAIAMLVVLPFAAFADDISNNIDTSIDAIAEVMPLNVGGANGTTQLYVTPRNGDSENGCNFQGNSESLVVSVNTSNASVATVSPTSITFGNCGDTPTLTVTPHNAGSATISVSQTSNNTGGTFNLASATFTVNVAAPSNTAPHVSVDGVTGGASYNKGSVPTATCQVTDAEDGNSSFPATLSAITGPYTSDGIGEQTASCSYTDHGGLTATASKTYGIVDPSPPSITPNVSGTLGNNGWYVSDVTVTWTVTDNESAISSSSGCGTTNITADTTGTTLTCSATSAGGASSQSVTIKRDATPPSITASLDKQPDNSTGWYNISTGAPTVSFSCSDGTSGLASTCPASHTFGEGADQSYSQTISDNAGNSASDGASNVDVDLTAPSITASLAPAAASTGWYNIATGAPTVNFTCSDSGSGLVGACPASHTFGEGANQNYSQTIFDNAGNSASDGVTGVNVDRTAPSISAVLSPAAAGTGWYNSTTGAPTVNFTCSDSGSSGLASGACPASHTFGEGANQNYSQTISDVAGNTSTSASVTGVNVDLTAPALNITGAASGANSTVCSTLPSKPTFAPDGSISGLASSSDTWTPSTNASGVGTYTYYATATDNAGNTANETRTYNVTYGASTFSGFLQPINSDGSSRFKLTSTIPVKFQLFCGSTPITNAVAKLYVAKGDSVPDPGVDEAISTSAATTGNLFRYDSTASQYIFNLSTKSGYMNPGATSATTFSTGSWTLKILLDDGSWKSVVIQLPK